MRLDETTTEAWADDLNGPVGPDGTRGGLTLADLLHDHAYQCEVCEAHFTHAEDLEDHWCEACRIDHELQGGDVDERREHGTW